MPNALKVLNRGTSSIGEADGYWVNTKSMHRVGQTFLLFVLALATPCCKRQLVDLAAELVRIEPPFPRVGEEIVFTYRVNNVGQTIAPPRCYSVELAIDGKVVNSTWSSPHPIKPGSYSEFSKASGFYDFRATKPGRVEYTITVQPSFYFKDSNPGNNRRLGTFDVLDAAK